MADTNKVKYGIKNCYYAVITEAPDGTISYGTPKRFPGAVSLGLDPTTAETDPFYADDIIYFQAPGRTSGYSGDFEIAKVWDDFRQDIYGEYADANGMQLEDADVMPKSFALMAEFQGDKHAVRHVWFNCTATRPSSGSATIEDSITPQTETITITSIPATFNDKHIIKGKVDPTNPKYATFFEAVLVPDTQPATPQVVLSDSNISIIEGFKRTITAAVVPAGTPVVWTSSDDTVATVTDGEITAVAPGTAVITATITVDSTDYTDTCNVTVVPAI